MCPVSPWLHRNGGPAFGIWGQCGCLFWEWPDSSGVCCSSRVPEHRGLAVQETGQGNGCCSPLFSSLFFSPLLSSFPVLPMLSYFFLTHLLPQQSRCTHPWYGAYQREGSLSSYFQCLPYWPYQCLLHENTVLKSLRRTCKRAFISNLKNPYLATQNVSSTEHRRSLFLTKYRREEARGGLTCTVPAHPRLSCIKGNIRYRDTEDPWRPPSSDWPRAPKVLLAHFSSLKTFPKYVTFLCGVREYMHECVGACTCW